MTTNQDITPEELAQIRGLPDFDLTMLLSEVSDHDWRAAKLMLADIDKALRMERNRPQEPPTRVCYETP